MYSCIICTYIAHTCICIANWQKPNKSALQNKPELEDSLSTNAKQMKAEMGRPPRGGGGGAPAALWATAAAAAVGLEGGTEGG